LWARARTTGDLIRVEPKNPADPVLREKTIDNPASQGLHVHAHPGSNGERLVGTAVIALLFLPSSAGS